MNKEIVVKVEIVFDKIKLSDAKLLEEIEYLGSGAGCTEWGKSLWKLGNFLDFRVKSVKRRKL